MKKRLVSLALSAVSLLSATAMTANALPYPSFQFGSDDYNKAIEGYTLLKYDPEKNVYTYGKDGYSYEIGDKKGEERYRYILFESTGKVFEATFSPETDKDELNEIMNRLAPDIKYFIYDKNPSFIYIKGYDYAACPETEGIIKQLKAEMNKKFDVQRFDYYGHLYIYCPVTPLALHEKGLYFRYFDETEDEIKAVIDELGLDVVLKFDECGCYFNCFYIVPAQDMALGEFFEKTLPLQEKFEWCFEDGALLSSPTEYSEIDVVDVLTAIDGDSNADGALTIADAALILQHIGNPDKYKLSAQGKFNADVVGNGDGISALDALAIQQYEAGVIDSLG